MRWKHHFPFGLIVIACVTAASQAGEPKTFIETFDRGSNEGGWIFMGLGNTVHHGSGGNPGWYISHTVQCCWPAPVVRTTTPSIFTGNFRELGVTSIGLDMILTLAQAPQHPDFSMTIMLVHDNGTPGNSSDDTRIYSNLGAPIPWPGQGWTSYDFDIPSQLDLPFGQLPPGWQVYQDDFGGPPFLNHTWREVMENVSEVWFIGANNPASIGFFWNWIIGVDNVRISYQPEAKTIPGDLNGDGVVDVFDLLILLSEWGECADPAECSADLNSDGVVDVFDLLILLSNWG